MILQTGHKQLLGNGPGAELSRTSRLAPRLRAPRRQRIKGATALFGRKREEPEPEVEEGTLSIGQLTGFGKRKQGPGAGREGTQVVSQKLGGPQDALSAISLGVNKIRRDAKTVFVAGATGRLGARIVRELVNKGFNVRAGVRDVELAQSYVDLAASYGLLPANAARRITLVPWDLADQQSLAAAIGNAGRVVQATGAAETDLLGLVFGGNAKAVDGDGAISIVNAAAALGVTQYIMVTSMGTGKVGFPASLLNLFGGVLTQKRRAEQALEQSGIAYTIVRPGGMERPTDTYKQTHNVRLAPRDTWFGGQVSRLQVAELVAAAIDNAALAENKVLEVQAETSAPVQDYKALLAAHPLDTADPKEQQRQVQEAQQAEAAKRQQQMEAVQREQLARRQQRPEAPKPVAQAAGAVQQAAPPKPKPSFPSLPKFPKAEPKPAAPAPARAAKPAPVSAVDEERAQAEFKAKADRNADELAQRRARAAQKQKEAEERALQTAQAEKEAADRARQAEREKKLASAAAAQAQAESDKPKPAGAAKPAPARTAPKPAPSAGKDGKAGAGSKADPASLNGKPSRFPTGKSTPEDIKQRKQEVQAWIKDWRKRTR